MKIKQGYFCKKFLLVLLLSLIVGSVNAQVPGRPSPPDIFLSASNGFIFDRSYNVQDLLRLQPYPERAISFRIWVAPNTKLSIHMYNDQALYNLAHLKSYSSGVLSYIEDYHEFFYTFVTGSSSDILVFQLWYDDTLSDILRVRFEATAP